MKYAERFYFAIHGRRRLVGGGRAGRGNGEEGLIARKYDKADGKRFVETLENLYEVIRVSRGNRPSRPSVGAGADAEINESRPHTLRIPIASLGSHRAFRGSRYSWKRLGISSRGSFRCWWDRNRSYWHILRFDIIAVCVSCSNIALVVTILPCIEHRLHPLRDKLKSFFHEMWF